MVKNGMPRQMLAIISDMRASHASPRKFTLFRSTPRRTSAQLMKLNCGSKIHHQANADRTVGTTYGGSSTERQKRTPAKLRLRGSARARPSPSFSATVTIVYSAVLIVVSRKTGSSNRYV